MKPPVQTTRNLRISYTADQRMELAKQLAEAHQTQEQIKADLKTVKSDFTARATSIAAKIADLSGKVGNGYHIDSVKCEIRLNTPKDGQKTVWRLDTNEAVEVMDMTEADKQAELPLADPDGGTTTKTVLDSDESGVVKVEADEDEEK